MIQFIDKSAHSEKSHTRSHLIPIWAQTKWCVKCLGVFWWSLSKCESAKLEETSRLNQATHKVQFWDSSAPPSWCGPSESPLGLGCWCSAHWAASQRCETWKNMCEAPTWTVSCVLLRSPMFYFPWENQVLHSVAWVLGWCVPFKVMSIKKSHVPLRERGFEPNIAARNCIEASPEEIASWEPPWVKSPTARAPLPFVHASQCSQTSATKAAHLWFATSLPWDL